MGFTVDLTRGLAEYLAAAGVGVVKDTGYLDSDLALVSKVLPQQPDRAVAIFPYPLTEDFSLSNSVTGVQFRIRGTTDPRDVENIGDQIFNVLHGRTSFDLSTGIHVVNAMFQSGAPGGLDGNSRWERLDNYYLTLHRPSQYRT